MEDLRQHTIDVYNENAQAMAAKFRSIPPRVGDIELTMKLAGNPEYARVVEIGCGDGRDAKEIASRAEWYLGIDPAEELIKLAQEHVPEVSFEVADAADFEYPADLDAVFAFASFIHLDKLELQAVFKKLHVAVKAGGVIYQSLKWAPEYKSETHEDRFGTRLYHFYNLGLIKELAGNGFEVAHTRHESREGLNHSEWLEVALRKS